MPNVNVKLKARCLVNGQVREAGEIVDLDEIIAKDFGEVVKPSAATGKSDPPKLDE